MPVWIFYDVRDCYPNAHSYRDLTPKETTTSMRTRRRGSMRKKVMEIEQGTFTPLVFTTASGMADEYVKYHSRL